MAPNVGTYTIETLLAARFQSAAEFGLDTIVDVLNADITAHNFNVQNMVSEMAEPTIDRQRIYGTSAGGDMIEVDEFGRGPTQVFLPGVTVGFPMRLFQYNIGWNRKWLENATPRDLAVRVLAAEKAHLKAVTREMKKAFFLSANYTFTDFLTDRVSLGVKRLVNADSANIPDGPNGETFDGSSHTHYLARAGGSLAATDLTSAINTVVEHGYGGDVKVVISRTDETTFRNLSGFTAYQDPRLIWPSLPTSSGTSSNLTGQPLDIARLDNRAIGVFGAAEVWVKPWAIANYAVVYDAASPNKPLCFRQRKRESLQGLRIAAEIETFPLQAQYMEAEFGIGVWTRTNGAVLYFGNTSYADPTIS